MTTVAAVLGLVLSALVVVTGPSPAHADEGGIGGNYVPLDAPQRVLDTRNSTGGPSGSVGSQRSVDVQVGGRVGVPASGVRAVLVDVSAVSPSAATWVTLWPTGASRSNLPMVNVPAGASVSNSAVVEIGDGNSITAFNRFGTTHIVIDVHGYFTEAPAGAGSGFVPVPHTRLVDTRDGLGAPRARVAAGGTVTLTVGNGSPIPASAAAAFINLVAVGATQQSYLTVYPAGGTPGRSTLNYIEGNTSSGAVVKLGTGGRIVVRNDGSAPVDVLLDAQGYFTGVATTGAGFRPLSARLHDTRHTGVRIPAHSNLEVQVAGAHGLPTRGIASALLNLMVAEPGGRGNLQAWPSGESRPSSTVVNFRAGEDRSGLVAVRPGADGRVVVRNSSSSAIDLWVGIQGWFAEPLPRMAAERSARTSVLQASPIDSAQHGVAYYSYVDNVGNVLVGRQTDPDSFSSIAWEPIAGNQAFTGVPALTQTADGHAQLAVQHTDSNIRTVQQATPGGLSWNAPSDIGGSPETSPVAGTLPDGTVVLFAVGANGRLWAYRQSGTAHWHSLGVTDLAGTPVANAANDGIRITGTTATGSVVTALYRADDSLSGWTDLGGEGITGQLGTTVYPGFRTMVVGRTGQGAVVVKQQHFDWTWPSEWTPVGSGFAAAGAPAVILDPVVARAAVVARGQDNEIYVNWETGQGAGTFGDWNQVAVGSDPAAGDPSVAPFSNSSGRSWIIVFRNPNDAHRVYWRNPLNIPAPTAAGASARSSDPATAPIEFVDFTLPAPPA